MTETLNASETMKVLRITRSTLAGLLAAGELRGFRRGKVIRVTRRSVEQLLGGVVVPRQDIERLARERAGAEPTRADEPVL